MEHPDKTQRTISSVCENKDVTYKKGDLGCDQVHGICHDVVAPVEEANAVRFRARMRMPA